MARRIAVVVDDEPDEATYLATVLRDHGWRVEVAHDAAAGLEAIRKLRPGVVLLDVMMPDRGGLSALAEIRRDPGLAGTRVVLVTGIQEGLTADFGGFLERFRRLGPDGYLEKPVAPEELLEAVEGEPAPAR